MFEPERTWIRVSLKQSKLFYVLLGFDLLPIASFEKLNGRLIPADLPDQNVGVDLSAPRIDLQHVPCQLSGQFRIRQELHGVDHCSKHFIFA